MLQEDLSPKFMIDQESGEIMLFDSSSCTNLDDMSFVISDKEVPLQLNQPALRESVDFLEIDPLEVNSDGECENGPLNGQVVEIEASNQIEIVYDDSEQKQRDSTYKSVKLNQKEIVENHVDSAEPVCDLAEGESEDNESLTEEIVQQTIYLDEPFKSPLMETEKKTAIINETAVRTVKEKEIFLEKKIIPDEPENSKDPGLFQTDRSLQSIILSNVEGVQQIAIVRKKGAQPHKFDQKRLLEHLTSVLTGDYQINRGGPLKILEIEVDALDRTEAESVKAKKLALTYAKKEISNTCLEVSGNMSVGTQASKWTKMAGERTKVN